MTETAENNDWCDAAVSTNQSWRRDPEIQPLIRPETEMTFAPQRLALRLITVPVGYLFVVSATIATMVPETNRAMTNTAPTNTAPTNTAPTNTAPTNTAPTNTAPTNTATLLRTRFQQGINGYASVVDTEIWALAPNTILESNSNASTDANNDGGESQVLLRFEDILGDRNGQIPPGSHVVSARLFVSAFDQGSTVNLHRMLVPFSRSATWASLVDGVSADDAEASRHKDSFTFGKIAANTSTVVFDVTDTVSAWVQGQPNHGWVFINTGGNGWDFYTSEFEERSQRPALVVEFEPPPSLADPEIDHATLPSASSIPTAGPSR